MRRRIALLLTALMLALTMVAGPVASGAFADPDCNHVDSNKNCVKDGPGKSEDSGGNNLDKNPNVETTFKGRPQ
jgi:hypothetical protein